MENQTTQKWYQKPVTVILFLIFFFPVGLYLMWKYDLWSKTTRIVVSVFFGLLVLGNINKENKNNSNSSNSSNLSSSETVQNCNQSSHEQFVREHFKSSGNDVYGISTLGNIGNCGYNFLVNGYDQTRGISFVCNVKTNGTNGIQIIDAGCDFN